MSPAVPVGGEMEFWDEPDPTDSPLLARLVSQALPAGRRRVLLVGPHPSAVLDALTRTGLDLVVLLRSLPAAERLAAARPEVRVLCGDPARTDAADLDGPVDAIVALGGVAAAASADEPWRPWRVLASQVVALAGPDAVLVLGHERTTSSARLGSDHRREADAGPRDWFPALGHDETRPRTAADLADALRGRAGEGGRAGPSWLVWPSLADPRLALAPAAAPTTAGTLAGALVERAAGLAGAAPGERPAAHDTVVAGLAAPLAPAEVVVVGVPATDVEPVVVADDAGSQAVVDDPAAPAVLLETRLLEHCVRHDAPALVRDLRAAVAWSDGDGAGRSCHPADVVVTPAGLASAPGAPAATPRGGQESAALLALAVASRLEALGWTRPWPRDLDADGLALVLAGLLDADLDTSDLDGVRPLVPETDRGGSDVLEPDAVARLRTENDALRGRTRALENALRGRDRQVWAERAVTEGAPTADDRRALRAEAAPPPAPPPSLVARVRRRGGRLLGRS